MAALPELPVVWFIFFLFFFFLFFLPGHQLKWHSEIEGGIFCCRFSGWTSSTCPNSAYLVLERRDSSVGLDPDLSPDPGKLSFMTNQTLSFFLPFFPFFSIQAPPPHPPTPLKFPLLYFPPESTRVCDGLNAPYCGQNGPFVHTSWMCWLRDIQWAHFWVHPWVWDRVSLALQSHTHTHKHNTTHTSTHTLPEFEEFPDSITF